MSMIAEQTTDLPENWLELPATRDLVKRLVEDEIFEIGLDPNYDREQFRLTHAYLLHFALENEERQGDPFLKAVGADEVAYRMGDVLDAGLSFNEGLRIGTLVAIGDYEKFPKYLKKCLRVIDKR